MTNSSDIAMVNAPDLPLISVIVRTKNRRSLLKEALDSVRDQYHQRIEMIVVNDGGEDVADLVDSYRGAVESVVYVRNEHSHGRSAAANIGMGKASGKYFVFLDDDDWFDACHVSALVAHLEGNDGIRAAYAGIRYMAAPDAEQLKLINHPFEPKRLVWGNYIPIHAVLFHRSLYEAGCRFDEALQVYEDWDFWLQLSQLTRFDHIDLISAGYRSGGSSGADPSVDVQRVKHARECIYDKWKFLWTGQQINDAFEWGVERGVYLELVKHATELKKCIDARREENEARDLALKSSQARIKALSDSAMAIKQDRDELSKQLTLVSEQLHAVLTSTSWRFSYPVRWIGNQTIRLRVLSRVLHHFVTCPESISPTLSRVHGAWRKNGLHAGWAVLKQAATDPDFNHAFAQWRRALKASMRDKLLASAKSLTHRPLISILLPTYNTPGAWLREAIDSVRAQIYDNWQLCVVDDGSSDPHVRAILESSAAKDPRICIELAPRIGNISRSTNLALAMAQGEYVVLMDHDDLLEPQALLRVAESINEDHPDMIYSDEVLVGVNGRDIVNHVFRPQFSLELLRSHPYIVHLACFRTSLMREIGGLDETMTISQDYDLILRIAEHARRIVHIPEPLYRWRQHGGSTGRARSEEVMAASRKAIARHLERCGELAEVEPGAQFNFFDVRYPLTAGQRVAIIIPTKNHGDLVRQCIDSIIRTINEVHYDIVLVDHASDDPDSLDYFASLKESHTVLRCDGPFNFSVINNWAINQLPAGRYSHYLLCNNDIEAIREGWLERMMAFAQKPDVGIVGAHLLYTDQLTIQHAGVCVGMYGAAEHYAKFMRYVLPDGSREPGYLGALIANHEMSAVTAACALVRRDAYEAVGGLDEALAVGFGDVDFCLRVREKGYRIMFCPNSILIHHESYSRGKSTHDPHPEDSNLFRSRWRAFLKAGDPYYNPNLTHQNTYWHLAEPLVFRPEVQRRVVDLSLTVAHSVQQ